MVAKVFIHSFIVGRPSEPSASDPDHGNKAIVADHGSTFDLHGKKRVAWTRLSQTALKGSNTLVVDFVDQTNVDWVVGEKLAITSSDMDAESFESQLEAQMLTITSISHEALTEKSTITVQETLEYDHYGEVQRYGNIKISKKADVVLLSRNVIVEGSMDAESLDAGWGGHLMMHTMGGRGSVTTREDPIPITLAW